jgi:FAD binding domain
MINTQPLNSHWVGLSPEDVSTSAVDPSRLVFAQCGTSVRELSETLEEKHGLSLPTSGASNGQTICGAISTGTHGSARRVGSMQDFILGLHLIADNGRNYWIERASKPTVSAAFCERLGATLLRDDHLFRAAVVSFGSFGILHAVLFEAAPGYLLEVHRRRFDWPQVAAAATTLDISALGFKYPEVEPFHVDMAVNPFRSGKGGQGAVVTVMYKRRFQRLAQRITSDVTMVPGVDLLAVSGKLANVAPATIPHGVNAMFDSMMKATERPPLGTHGQVFPCTPMAGKSLSTEIGVDIHNARAAVEVLIATARKYPFPGLFGLRYVQRSDAYLAFTKFDTTCTIEVTGAGGGDRTQGFYDRAWAALDAAKIPYTQHWGKINNTTGDNIRERWGSAVDDWLRARRTLLSPAGRTMFANDLLTNCELHH